jgi:hypothetical protein
MSGVDKNRRTQLRSASSPAIKSVMLMGKTMILKKMVVASVTQRQVVLYQSIHGITPEDTEVPTQAHLLAGSHIFLIHRLLKKPSNGFPSDGQW